MKFISLLLTSCLIICCAHAATKEESVPQKPSAFVKTHMTKPRSDQAMDPVETNIRKRVTIMLSLAYQALNQTHKFPSAAGLDRGQLRGVAAKCWELVKPEGAVTGLLAPKVGGDLKEALDTIFKPNQTSYFDCTQAAVFAQFFLVHYVLPAGKKNLLLEPFFLKAKCEERRENKIKFRHTIASSGYLWGPDKTTQNPFEPGDFVYFHGHPEYANRYPLGYAQGESTFFLGFNDAGQRLYIGFGDLFKDGPRTAKDIQTSLARAYYAEDKGDDYDAIFKTIRERSTGKRHIDMAFIKAANPILGQGTVK